MKIIKAKAFRVACGEMGLTLRDMKEISASIADNPDKWPIMENMEGAQKARYGLQNKGKRDGARVIYFVAIFGRIFFLFAYAKSKQKDLTNAQRDWIKAFIRNEKERGYHE